MSLDELMNIEVTSVSRGAEPYQQAAAALTVITNDDIRRSGATSIPEALRGVPGLHVAQQNASAWAVSSRGFSSINSEKLLVLSDTRSIYTPLFSGVAWDVQDYLLDDVERIEVIRGPGAALWGSNAVNGVINITTKNAADTHGTLLEASTGTDENAMVAARYGAQTRGGFHYRVFGKYVDHDETRSTGQTSDDWQLGHLGFRADWTPTPQSAFTVQGDLYDGTIGLLTAPVTVINRPGPTGRIENQVSGGNILGRWRHEISDTSDLQLRFYYDRTNRDNQSYSDQLDTFDLDLQQHVAAFSHHELTWGLNYRETLNRNEGKGIFAVDPPSSRDRLYSTFIQDQFSLMKAVRVTVGTKAEHNDFSGFELQPSIRASWDVTKDQVLWAAVSRAARIPTRLERDVSIDVSDPTADPVYRLLGSDDFDAEELVAYELGYRWRASELLRFDVALFENRYEGLSSLEMGDPFVDPASGHTIVPVTNKNLTSGHSEGVETQVTFAPVDWWHWVASYSYFNLSLKTGGLDLNRGEFYEGATPRHQFGLTSSLTLRPGLELDARFRHLSAIRRLPEIITGEGIPGYSELDVTLTWRASQQWRISIVGRNLLHDEHIEFGTPEARSPIPRGVYGKMVWEF